ncbi:hypothetical protein LCGC14_2915600 [marine sediment metagenome]|uniref:Uncharacterized protein n=1 Tax=marine sediment metagenome TaxID=412755 RepID=A0A0F8XQD9_9ZZZZ
MNKVKMLCKACGLIFHMVESGVKESQQHFCPMCHGNALRWIEEESKVKAQLGQLSRLQNS